MPLSLKTRLAQAKRHLRRIEEDEPAFRLRISGLTPEEQKEALRSFHRILEKQLEYVRGLEEQILN